MCTAQPHRLNLYSLFWLHVHSCTHWLRPRHPPPPPHSDSYTRTLLVSLDRRHLYSLCDPPAHCPQKKLETLSTCCKRLDLLISSCCMVENREYLERSTYKNIDVKTGSRPKMCQLVLAAAQFLFWHFNNYDSRLVCLSLWI